MPCGIGQHVMVFSYHNPYDNVDVYECMNCDKRTYKDAGPLYEYQITCACCGVPHEAYSKAAAPFMKVGDVWDCPNHGPSTITNITSKQVKGKAVDQSATAHAREPTTADGVIGVVFILVVLALLLAGCVAVIR